MDGITVRKAEERDRLKWDAYVVGHPDGTPYHLYAWVSSVSIAYKKKNFSLVAERNREIVGVLPLVLIGFPFAGKEFVALPYCDIGNCLGDTAAAVESLLSKALDMAKKVKVKRIDLRGDLNPTEIPGGGRVDRIEDNKVRMLLDLPESSDHLMKSFKSKLRSQIRKSEKNDLTFRWGSSGDLDAFYTVFSRNMRDLGSPVHSRTWFREVLKQFGANARIGLVELHGRAVATGIILAAGNTVSIPWASTIREFNRLSPNMLLYWNFLKFASDNHFTQFDFGRSTRGEGTYKFKAQWGAKPIPLEWYEISITETRKKTTIGDSLKRDLAAAIWCRIPLPLTEFLGPMIRHHISL